MHNGDHYIFDNEDNNAAGDMLKAMLIKLFLEKEITFDKFSQLHRTYMFNVGIPAKKIASNRNNLLKAILNKDTMTYSMFEFIVKNILGFNLVNISMRLKDKENKTFELSMDRITF